MKPLLWSSLKSAKQGSMWAEIQNPDEAAQVLEINMSELECLFLRESREEEQAAARFLPPQIDRERAHNCTIMLSDLKIPFNELMIEVVDEIQETTDRENGKIVEEEEEVLKDDIYTAAAYGDLEKLQRLVESEGCSVSKPDSLGYSALQWAALNYRAAAAQYIIQDHVLALDNSVLDADQLDNIIQFCPTKEEMDQLKDYKGDTDELGKCEQFFLELMKVPRAEYKLIAFSYMLRFESRVSELRQSLNLCHSAIEQIRSSAKLKRVMQTLLCLGNALNQGTARGGAVGFRLDTLLKLTDTRARNSRMTVMHYLCKVLADKLPEVLDFSKDLRSLEPASKMQLKLLAEKMQVINRGFSTVIGERRFAKKEGCVSKKFRKGLKEFLCSARNEVCSLVSLFTTLVHNEYALARYFDEDPVICTYEQIVLTLLEFTRVFNQAIEENAERLEAEKKVASEPQMKS